MENNAQAQETQAVEQEQAVKTYSQEEVDALLQKNGDKRVSEALKTAKQKWEQEYTQKMNEEKRLSQLTQEEREREIQMKEAEKFKAQLEEFEKAKAEFQKQQLEAELMKELSNEGLPVHFAQWLLGADAEATNANLQAFKAEYVKAVQEAVEKHVEDKLRGKEPAKGTNSKALTKAEFLKLPYKERSKLLEENRELVEQILNE